MPSPDTETYTTRQSARDREYLAAWEASSDSFKKSALNAGIKAPSKHDPGHHQTMALEFQDGYASTACYPDIASGIDTFTDTLVERHGCELVVRAVAEDYSKLVAILTEQHRAMLLARVVGTLIETEAKKLTAMVHGLLHSIPRMAIDAGFGSMRSSAREVHVTVEWIRKSRDEWCSRLQIPIPEDGKKTKVACAKYKVNALTNHWKKQKATVKNLNSLLPSNP